MGKHAVIFIALAVALAGCSSSQYRSIPVVESGGPLTPGAMRDSRARQAATQPTQAPREQDSSSDTVQAYAAPSAPIGGIETYSPQDAQQQVTQQQRVISSNTTQAVGTTPAAPIGGQARLAADEQLDGAVLALLTTAQQQQGSGDYNGAASSLERAQRIAPREPQVLYRLAEVRLAQGDAGQAEQLAQRGLGYSNDRPALQASLWDLIARARAQQGNTAGALEAQRRARVNL